jgi:hypothetical protein
MKSQHTICFQHALHRSTPTEDFIAVEIVRQAP